MLRNKNWTRDQLLVAFNLYCQIPFGKIHSRNPIIVRHSKLIGRTPAALSMKLANIASLDLEITSTGRKGLQGASATDKAMWGEMQNDWGKFAIESERAVEALNVNSAQKSKGHSEQLDEKKDYTGSTKSVITKTRVGQGFFRKAVLSAYDYQCCITGLSIPNLLVASHIVPWREDASNRLNPRNGLSLSMLHDKAFDIGLITINEDMTVRISQKHLHNNDYFFSNTLLNYHGKPISLPEKFHPHPDFLDYHRKNIFEHTEIKK